MEQARRLEFARTFLRADVDRVEPAIARERGDLAFSVLVVAGDEHVESLAGDLLLVRGPAKVVLNAFTKRAPRASAANSFVAEPSGGTTSPSNVSLTGFVMSTTTFPASWSAYRSTAARASG